jgi:hypothetical protein
VPRGGAYRSHGRDINDRSFGYLQMRQCMLDTEHRASNVHGEDSVPSGDVDLVGGFQNTAALPGIVDKKVEAAKGGQAAGYCGFYIGLTGDVGRYCHTPDPPGGPRYLGLSPADRRHSEAFSSELHRNRFADPAAGTGDKGCGPIALSLDHYNFSCQSTA